MQSTLGSTPTNASKQTRWFASLSLDIEERRARTVLARNERSGPIQVQRPFPQPHGGVHLYILHPPGGIAGGDQIDIKMRTGPQSRALVTTPSATKFYRVEQQNLIQSQTTRIQCDAGSVFEWLPLETIVFRGSTPHMATYVDLASCKCFVGWEIIALGRTASGEQFDQGSIQSLWQISRDQRLVHRENFMIADDSEYYRSSAWGLNEAPVLGSMFISDCPVDAMFDEKLAVLRAQLETMAQTQGDPRKASIEMTQKSEVLIVRYLGGSSQACRLLFNVVRHFVLEMKGVPADDARIWST